MPGIGDIAPGLQQRQGQYKIYKDNNGTLDLIAQSNDRIVGYSYNFPANTGTTDDVYRIEWTEPTLSDMEGNTYVNACTSAYTYYTVSACDSDTGTTSVTKDYHICIEESVNVGNGAEITGQNNSRLTIVIDGTKLNGTESSPTKYKFALSEDVEGNGECLNLNYVNIDCDFTKDLVLNGLIKTYSENAQSNSFCTPNISSDEATLCTSSTSFGYKYKFKKEGNKYIVFEISRNGVGNTTDSLGSIIIKFRQTYDNGTVGDNRIIELQLRNFYYS